MSKELEAFEHIMRIYGETNSLEGTYDDFLIIKRALQRLEQIDNSSPSDALEKFDYIGNDVIFAYDDDYVSYDYTDDVEYIKQALIQAQEQKKVLKILIEKNVDILAIKESKTLEDYNRNAWEVEHYGKYNGYRLQLTQEEFDLLKR